MSNAKILALMGTGGVVDLAWLQGGVALFNAVPSLGALGSSSGFESRSRQVGTLAEPISTKIAGSPFRFVEALVAGGPVMVRRSAVLEVGVFDSSSMCPDQCNAGVEGDMSSRLYSGGWSVGVRPSAASAGAAEGLCGAVDKAQAAEAGATAASGAATSRVATLNGALGGTGGGGPATCPKGGPPSKPESNACKGPLEDRPQFSIIMQYFKRPSVIAEIYAALSKAKGVTYEIIINNDSGGDVDAWTSQLDRENSFMSHAHDIHEIRAYNRMGKFAAGKYLAFLQDDDVPRNPLWMKEAFSLFNTYPKMGMLGGFRGRHDSGETFNVRVGQLEGVKYGPGFKKMTHICPTTKVPFMFMYKINAAPMIVKRGLFNSLGGFNTRFSCPGDAGIGFDFEFSVRLWYYGKQVGLYYSQFKHHAGDTLKSGTRTDGTKWVLRKMRERENNLNLYDLYPGFHPEKGTAMALRELNKLKVAAGKHAFEEITYVKPGDVHKQSGKVI
mmetsp:Transcript_39141/g.124590  ORF Transcript_39141/g.124590 Transcript_39141/m.124590 type:complete len:499 (+) Transcript_39141:956-2452(+)